MQSLKLTLKFTSPLASALQSDTIFGQFCWYYSYIYGVEKLESLINQEKPFAVFSDGFLENHIPMPVLKPISIDKFGDYADIKRFKKLEFIKASALKDVDVLDAVKLIKLIKSVNFEKKSYLERQVILRNSIDRITNTTLENGLYQTEEVFFDKDARIDIYVKYDSELIDKDCITKVFDYIGQSGFGKDKSIGKGRFKITNLIENPDLLKEKQTKTFISLSSGVTCDDCEVLFGKTFVKFGKHGGYGLPNPFKNPVIMFKSGSTFKIKNFKPIFGKSLSVSKYKNHKHGAYLLPLFVDVEE
ncbi:type III-A CRISPR-associated RAMP protein Csm4 [Desulfurella multipotens]|uniref:type III-A CRISPR-associated RAMP protein Csm4 n=1 Tax=Desulfurella multipotens TaxID=79269 RepID=UPI000CBF26C8|nr:hypothetical protein [Desulfurella multipotens]PMP65197.1 MAG: hypothetical protein C0192_05585 [Desulfurella multipotens]